MLRNLSCASVMEKARSRLELISRRWSFLTLLTNPSTRRGLFFATTRRPQHGRGLTVIRLPPPSISQRAKETSAAGTLRRTERGKSLNPARILPRKTGNLGFGERWSQSAYSDSLSSSFRSGFQIFGRETEENKRKRKKEKIKQYLTRETARVECRWFEKSVVSWRGYYRDTVSLLP